MRRGAALSRPQDRDCEELPESIGKTSSTMEFFRSFRRVEDYDGWRRTIRPIRDLRHKLESSGKIVLNPQSQ
jgi:hypothetical protein